MRGREGCGDEEWHCWTCSSQKQMRTGVLRLPLLPVVPGHRSARQLRRCDSTSLASQPELLFLLLPHLQHRLSASPVLSVREMKYSSGEKLRGRVKRERPTRAPSRGVSGEEEVPAALFPS